MTPDQEEHLDSIKTEFLHLVDGKYRKGQLEHGGNLFDMNSLTLVENAIEETIDQFVYLVTLRDRMNQKG